MLQPQHNKQNIRGTNALYLRDSNKSKANLFEAAAKTSQSGNGQLFFEELSLKVYQQRIRNKFLFDKIRVLDGFFGYQLRPQLKSFASEDTLVREYGKLLEQYQFLEKHWAKIQAVVEGNTQKQSANFQFLLSAWHKKQPSSPANSTEIIERLNKTVLFIKKEIDSSLKKDRHSNQHLSYQELVRQSPEYLRLSQQLEKANNRLREKEHQLIDGERERGEELVRCRRQNQLLLGRVEELQMKGKQYEQRQKELYSTINKLSKQLIEKGPKKQESKGQAYYRKYVSEVAGEETSPEFQIIIKSKPNPQQKRTKIISKPLREIELFFDSNIPEQKQDNHQEVIGKQQNDLLLQTPKVNASKAWVQDLYNQQADQTGFSSIKKRKISAIREIYSGTKLFPKWQSEDCEQVAKQLKFIRKR